MMDKDLQAKVDKLHFLLRSYGRVAVAFSAGVDSTVLLKAAQQVMSNEQILALTAESVLMPASEIAAARAFCEQEGLRQQVTKLDLIRMKDVRNNPTDRCYYCKKELFTKIKELAAENGCAYVAEGSNMDDLGDYRPGLRAIAELGVMSPLREAGLYKAQIREISRELGLPTWKKQSFACLATRFVYGEHITDEKLERVDKAEQLLMDLGLGQLRVRIHGEDGKLARIEVLPEEFEKLLACREEIVRAFKQFGFEYTAMELGGYRTGSMNGNLGKTDKKE